MKLRRYKVMYGQRYFNHGFLYVEAQNRDRAELVTRQWMADHDVSRLRGCTVEPWDGDFPEGVDTASEADYPRLAGI